MDTSLVAGLEAISFTGTGSEEQVGSQTTKVNTVADNLEEYAGGIQTFINDLSAQEKEILLGWEGETAEEFKQSFPGLLEAFEAIPSCVRSIADWSRTTGKAYTDLDRDTREVLQSILGGIK